MTDSNLSRRQFLTKQLLQPNASASTAIDFSDHSLPKQISSITFSIQSPHQIAQSSVIHLVNPFLYQHGHQNHNPTPGIGNEETNFQRSLPKDAPTNQGPVKGGVLDRRLGVSDRLHKCDTCGEKLASCPGHFGYIQLELPVFHIGYYKHLQNVLQCICKSCSRVLLDEYDRKKYLRQLASRKDTMGMIERENIQKKILEKCKRVKECPRCGVPLGNVKKVVAAATMRLMHDVQLSKSQRRNREFSINLDNTNFNDTDHDRSVYTTEKEEKYLAAIEYNHELREHVHKITDPLNPRAVIDILKAIPNGDLPLLWMHPNLARPEQLILSSLPVPPVAIRPSVPLMEGFGDGGGTNEDDLTMKLKDILLVNRALKKTLNGEANAAVVAEHWESLQNQVSLYLNGEIPGSKEKALRGLVQRLKGKTGRFRGNLSGKRVDFTARTVISPDPNLSVLDVGVPLHVAKTLTFPEAVTSWNLDRMQQLVRNGPNFHPGALYIRQRNSPTQTGVVKALQFGDRRKLASELRVGDIVERHIIDGDYVLFNRQPSLHKMSIMCHRVKVLEGRTLRFNLCDCAPYNADFDGDEMNLHLPQTEEARAEAAELMAVLHNIVTPRHGAPMIAATQDFFTSSYLMTQKGVFLTFGQMCNIAASCGAGLEKLVLPPPAILLPIKLWTGKQAWGFILAASTRCNTLFGTNVSLEGKERNFIKPDSGDDILCENDGYFTMRQSEVITGNLGKGILGSSKSGIMYTIMAKHGNFTACHVLDRLTKATTRWLTNYGFTIGIDDVTPPPNLLVGKERVIQEGYAACDVKLRSFQDGTLRTLPGCNLEESLESELGGILSKVRDESGSMCMQELPHYNKPFVMATCGSKGSPLNICQMISCVGQQIVGGNRMPNGFMYRSLPHFKFNAREPDAKGFVANSFFSGLEAPEFFFHTMGGREGLVDTAVKTAETGYMARRLMKALEDLFVTYDKTVRASTNDIVQFTYGDDGLYPATMETNIKPIDASKLLNKILWDRANDMGDQPALSSAGMKAFVDVQVEKQVEKGLERFSLDLDLKPYIVHELRSTILKAADDLEKLIKKLGLTGKDVQSALDLFSEEKREDILPIGSKSVRDFHRSKHYPDTSLEAFYLRKFSALHNTKKYSHVDLKKFLDIAVEKYAKSEVEPGEAVGAVGAQSLGEPGTQMTLKTFHFAGVASMNVTLGVPRIREIINATKNISTPIITVQLANPLDERSARIVQSRIESTCLGQVCKYIEAKIMFHQVFLVVQLDRDAINALHLEDVSCESIKTSIINEKGLKIKDKHVRTFPAVEQLHILLPPTTTAMKNAVDKMLLKQGDRLSYQASNNVAKGTMYYECTSLKQALSKVKIAGISTVHRAVVNKSEDKTDEFHLLVEGIGLLNVLGIPGVDALRTTTNNIMEIDAVLGIEAARTAVMSEVAYIFGRYGLSIDVRHLMLLADVMSYKGEILGITRYGISKMKESVLMLASFEKTAEHLFSAAVHAKEDQINGVSECIIVGNPVPLGTGLSKLITAWRSDKHKPARRGTWIDNLSFGEGNHSKYDCKQGRSDLRGLQLPDDMFIDDEL